MTRYSWMLLVPLLWLVPAGAHGQEDSNAANSELAKRHFELGEQLYNTSSYAKALVEFKKAYELVPRAELLFNIARCHEVLAQLDQAIDSYERYLKGNPNAANADLVRSRLGNLRQRQKQQQDKKKEEEDRRKSDEESKRQAAHAEAEKVKPPSAGTTTERPSRWKRTAGWVTVGVGGAALVTGIVFGVLAKKKASEYKEGVKDGKYYNELNDIDKTGKRFSTLSLVTLIVGGVGVAAGAGLVVWDWSSNRGETRSARLIPFGEGGLAAQVRF